jgi:hypothetical protein
MNWDKKIYPKDVWNWIKNYLWRKKPKRLKRPAPWPPPQGGFTPRREVSRISRARFDDRDSLLNRLKREDRWAMEAYDFAERTGLWDSNMADGPVIDGEPLLKVEREKK